LAVNNFAEINGNHSSQQGFSVSIKVSKEIVPFPQVRIRIPNLWMQCKKLFTYTFRVG